ncbi:DUF1572 family protein [Bacillus testis]|uniref:DUF1572 family protein n=1 Tax=Bacillus testis TaxID=1622072 RepID=UPI00067ECB88|nr:DUF1572 family protein [Bacillus testis]
MIGKEYLRVVRVRINDMKKLAEGAFSQVSDSGLFWHESKQCNSIAVIVKHLSGNMVSRWTDFLTSDGEKESRNRDGEFIQHFSNRQDMLRSWNLGWNTFFAALESLRDTDLLKTVTIQQEPHSVIEALEKQMVHYSYHIGQIVYIAKQLAGDDWTSLSVPLKQQKV